MSVPHLQQAIEFATTYLAAHPEQCRHSDSAATAVVVEGLRCRAEGANGQELVSDMPRAIGGGSSAPSPSWLVRAALATCDATVIAMRAAQLGVTLTTLEVRVESESDDRGLLGMDDAIPAGLLNVRTRIRIGAQGGEPERLRAIVQWAQAHSPVADTIQRAIPATTEVEIA